MDPKETLEKLFATAVDAVRGDRAVARALQEWQGPAPDHIIAVGKAAAAMAAAAHARFPEAPVLVVTKYEHAVDAPPGADVIEAAHPVLDDNSLHAGQRLLETVASMPPGSHLLMLVSGGASALAEAPVDGMDLHAFRTRTEELLGSGADIHAMNKIRRSLSQIKGGKLLGRFEGGKVTSLALSDVEGDALSVIGSGLGDAPQEAGFDFTPRIVASNAIARAAVVAEAQAMGLRIRTNAETLYQDVTILAPKLARTLVSGAAGLHLWGGEPTVVLPPNPGRGGRNQALALSLAREIAGQDRLTVLVAGTDGTDGPTDAAGAVIDGTTWHPSGAEALRKADAGSWLDPRGALLRTGPTGTNVMDLVIALKT